MKTLETERLILRPWKLSDAEALLRFTGDPEVAPAAGCPLHQSVGEAQEMIRSMLEKGGAYAVTRREDGEVIGQIGYFPDPMRSVECDSRMIGYMLSREQWGNGYIPEAVRRLLRHLFEDVGAERVAIGHFSENANSRRVIEKCGFVREGTMRRSMFRRQDGAVLDETLYSLSKSEYEALRALEGGTAI